mgnify:CR=1 FL=1
MTIQLYCFGESGNAYKAALPLELASMDWRPVFVDFFNGATRTEDYRRELNAMGEVQRNLGFGELRFFSRVHYGGGAACVPRVCPPSCRARPGAGRGATRRSARNLRASGLRRALSAPLPEQAIQHPCDLCLRLCSRWSEQRSSPRRFGTMSIRLLTR